MTDLFHKKWIGILGIVASTYIPVLAQDATISFNGFADTYHAIQIKHPHEYLSSRTRVRLEMRADYDNSSFYASTNAIYNSIVSENTGLSLHEAYFLYNGNSIEVKLGRQIITWGVADGIPLTDVISPMDYTEFMANDYDDIRIPVNAARIRYQAGLMNLDAVFVPSPEFYKLPLQSSNPWNRGFTSSLEMDLSDTPEIRLKNSEYGLRSSLFLSGIDFSFCALHTFNKSPIMRITEDDSRGVYLKGFYDEMIVLGTNVSIPFGEFVFRGEFAEYLGEALQTKTYNDIIHKNTEQALAGIDWYAQNDWTFMLQYMHRHIPDHTQELDQKRHKSTITFRISKELLRNTLKLSESGTIYINDRAIYSRTQAEYQLNDQISLYAGLDIFYGEKGIFDRYEENSEIWVKARYNF